MHSLLITLFLMMAAATAALNINHVYHKEGDAPAAKSNLTDGPFGGVGGDPWSDGSDGSGVYLNGEITKIEIRSGSRVDAFRVQYGDTFSEKHGGIGGSLTTIELQPGEVIVGVLGREGAKVDELEFLTNKGIYGPYGGGGGEGFTSAHYHCRVIYFSGRSGVALDAISVHYECPDEQE